MKTPVLVFALGPEAAAIAARAKAIWEVWGAGASVLAIGPANVAGLDPETDVAPLERDGQDLPRAAIATALAGHDPHPDVVIVADLAEHEAVFCARLAFEARRAIGPDRRLSAILVLPGPEHPPLELSAVGDILGVLWPGHGAVRLLDRLYLMEDAAANEASASREMVREVAALRLAIEGDGGAIGEAVRGRSDALEGPVRSLGGAALRYPGRAVAELAGARLAGALVEGWCGAAADPGGPLPDALPVDDDALEYAGLTPESTAELEAFLDELLWSLRARYPKIAAVASVLPAELALLEDVHFGAEGSAEGDIPVLIRQGGDDKPRSVLEPSRERLQAQIVRWRSRIEWELVDRCRPVFLEGGGLARGVAFLEALGGAIDRMDRSLNDRRKLAEDRQVKARDRLDAALTELSAASRKPFFRNAAAAASLADCRRAAVLYLTTRAERVLLADFGDALGEVGKTVADLEDRLGKLTTVLGKVREGLDDRARGIAEAWRADNLLDPGDPETAYRDAVGPLPDEEALLASVHEDFVAGGSVFDLPIQAGDEQHLVERLHERAVLRFPALLESTFGQGLGQRLPNASLRAERLAAALEAATPLLRLAQDEDGNAPGKALAILAHEPSPPEALVAALSRLGIPEEDRAVLPRKMADHLVIWTERADFPPDAIRAIEHLPGSWPPREHDDLESPVPSPEPEATPPAAPDDTPAPAYKAPEPDPEDGVLAELLRDEQLEFASDAAELTKIVTKPGLAASPDPPPTPDAAPAADPDDGLLAAMLPEEDSGYPQPAPPPEAAAPERETMVEDLDDGLLAQMLAEEGLT